MTSRSPRPSRRRIWSGLLVALVGALVVIHLAGGWYLSGRIAEEAFRPGPSKVDDVALVSLDDGTATFVADADHEGRIFRGEVLGFQTDAGYLRVGPVVRREASSVEREIELVAGELPTPPVRGFVDTYAVPPDPGAIPLDIEEITFEGPLGPLDGWYVEGSRPEWVVLVHGKGTTLQEPVRIMEALSGGGYHQLAIRYRNDPGQPPDPSGLYRYGRTEWEDVEAAVDHARAEGARSVVLVGYSTGAAAVLSYLYRAPIGVAGAVLDSPTLDLESLLVEELSRRELPIGLGMPITLVQSAMFFASLRLDVNWDAIDYVRRADRLPVPVLVFHGTADTTVPVDASRRFAEMAPSLVTLVEVEGAGHTESWNADPDGYASRVSSFVADVLR